MNTNSALLDDDDPTDPPHRWPPLSPRIPKFITFYTQPVTTADLQELARRRVTAQAEGIRQIDGDEAAQAFLDVELPKAEAIAPCRECGRDLVGGESCPKSHDDVYERED